MQSHMHLQQHLQASLGFIDQDSSLFRHWERERKISFALFLLAKRLKRIHQGLCWSLDFFQEIDLLAGNAIRQAANFYM